MPEKFMGVREKPLKDPETIDVIGPRNDRITIPAQDFDWYEEQGYEEAPEWKDPGTFYEVNEINVDESFEDEFVDEE